MNKKRTILFAFTLAVAMTMFSIHLSMSTIITVFVILVASLITVLLLVFFSARPGPPHTAVRKALWIIAVVLTLIEAVGAVYMSIGQLYVLGWTLAVFVPVLILMLLKKVWAGWLFLAPILFMTFLTMLFEGTTHLLLFIIDGPLVLACFLYFAAFKRPGISETLSGPISSA